MPISILTAGVVNRLIMLNYRIIAIFTLLISTYSSRIVALACELNEVKRQQQKRPCLYRASLIKKKLTKMQPRNFVKFFHEKKMFFCRRYCQFSSVTTRPELALKL